MKLPEEGRRRVVVEAVTPSLDAGRFAVKRIVGDTLTVEADVFADGHDELAVRLAWQNDRDGDELSRGELPMRALGNDRWQGEIPLEAVGQYRYTVIGWIDVFATWARDLAKRVDAGQDVSVDLRIGTLLIAAGAARARSRSPDAAARLQAWADFLVGDEPVAARAARALDPGLAALLERFPDRSLSTAWRPDLRVVVDRERARFSAWYELFPRSASPDPARHGTLRDVLDRLPYLEEMGFDVLYLPPIHPIGSSHRKGPNNVVGAAAGDPGVPWAIGSPDGGHTAIHAALGTLADFDELCAAAHRSGIEIALDIAFQASPDHPWVTEHPAWFRRRPDGTMQYAENPPKKYQDIVPFDFESPEWPALWEALEGVFRFWIDHGVRTFRVDNPHTKPFAFWEWVIGRLKADHPDLLFLAEAFTRPKVMQQLAKVGFSQSYTYFTWRTSKAELTEYFTELTTAPLAEYFRPNAWPNTPDILHEVLQLGGRPMFETRFLLAATLSSDYGIYGPAYELLQATPIQPGSEEYLDSEKYQQRTWDLDQADSLRPLISRVNRFRRAHPAMQRNDGLRFQRIDNERLLAYTKQTADHSDVVLVVICLDPSEPQSGTLELELEGLGIDPLMDYEVHDELSGETYRWQGPRNRIALSPGTRQAHLFSIQTIGAGPHAGTPT
jgi:starch synthase (maltosyl-transferring)